MARASVDTMVAYLLTLDSAVWGEQQTWLDFWRANRGSQRDDWSLAVARARQRLGVATTLNNAPDTQTLAQTLRGRIAAGANCYLRVQFHGLPTSVTAFGPGWEGRPVDFRFSTDTEMGIVREVIQALADRMGEQYDAEVTWEFIPVQAC